MTSQPVKTPTTISTTEFLIKFSQILWRLPSMIYTIVKGLKSIGGDKNISWGLELERIAALYPDNPAVKSPDGSLTYRQLNEQAKDRKSVV